MNNYDREDIYEYNELEKIIDIKSIYEGFCINSYVNILKLCIDFILNELLTKDNLEKLNIDSEAEQKARHYMFQARAYFIEKTISNKILEKERISCWEEETKYSSESISCWKKNENELLFRLIVCFLYDEKLILEGSESAQDPELFIIFACLNDLGSGYCKQLRLFLQKNLIQ